MDAVLIYITAECADQAMEIGTMLVERRLAACANVLPVMHSVYRWKGRVERAEEAVLVAKTRAGLVDALTAAVREVHSYEVPCVVAAPITGGNPDFLQWIFDETAGA